MQLSVGAATDTGRVRELNEDAYALRPEQGLFVVCDGMGGTAGGEVASQMAVQTIVAHLIGANQRSASSVSADGQEYLPQTTDLAEAVRRSNHVIFEQAQKD